MPDTLPTNAIHRQRARGAHQRSLPHQLTNCMVIIVLLLGLSVMVVWHWPQEFPAIHASATVMAYSTAGNFVLCALALFALNLRHRGLMSVCTLPVVLIAILTLLDNLDQTSTGIHGWFVQQPLAVIASQGGTMTSLTASCFLLYVTALLLLGTSFGFSKARRHLISALCAVIILGTGLSILLGYLIGLEQTYIHVRMAAHTAIGFIALAVGILALTRASMQSKIAIDTALLLILQLIVVLLFWQALRDNDNHQQQTLLNSLLTQTTNDIDNALQRHVQAQLRRAKRWGAAADTPQVQWQRDAENYLHDEPGILWFAWADANARLRWTTTGADAYRRPGNTPVGGDVLSLLLKKNMPWMTQKTSNKNEPVCRVISRTDTAAFSLLVLCSVFKSGEYDGAILSQLAIHILFTPLDELQRRGYFVRVSREDGSPIYGDAQTRSASAEREVQRVDLHDIGDEHLHIEAWPSQELDGATRSRLPDLVLLGGILLACVVSAATHFALSNRQQTKLLQAAQDLAMLNIRRIAKANRRFSQMVEGAPNAMVLVNQDGTIEMLNAQTEKIFGYNRADLLGQSIDILLPERFRHHHPQQRDSFFADPSPREIGIGRDLFGRRQDGSEFPVEIGLNPIETEEGIKVLSAIVDITERRSIERTLHESRERLALATQANRIGIWDYNPDEGTLVWDSTMFALYGRGPDDFSGAYEAWKNSIHPDDIARCEQALQNAIAGQAPFDCDFRVVHPSGEIRYIRAKAVVYTSSSEQQRRVLGTNIDITEEKLATEKLHATQALQAAIIESSDDAILSKTLTGVITSWNSGAERIFGYRAEEVIGQPVITLLIPPQLVDEELMLMERIRSGESVRHFDTLRRRKDGRVINVSVTLSPIRDSAGIIIGISAIKRDITDRMLVGQRLAEQSGELTRSHGDLQRFAEVSAHHLQEPSRRISSYAERLATQLAGKIDGDENEDARQSLKFITQQARRLKDLLRDVERYLAADQPRGPLALVDVRKTVDEVILRMTTQIGDAGAEIVIGDLPPACIDTPRLADLFQVALDNALTHAHNEMPLRIVIAGERQGTQVCYSITDNGPGIEVEYHERVFRVFERLSSDSLGTGIGLAILRRVTEHCGGRAWIETAPGGGCRVLLELPSGEYS